MLTCPKTHYDRLKDQRPRWVEFIQQSVATLPPTDRGYTASNFKQEEAAHFVKDEIVDNFRRHLIGHGRSSLGITIDDAIYDNAEHVEHVFKTSCFELSFIGNFEIYGQKTFFFGPNLARKLAETELNVSSELLTLPFPACLFAYDTQEVRDAFFKTIGQEAPTDGVVSVYLSRYRTRTNEEGLATYSTYHDNKGDKRSVMKREMILRPGDKIEDVLRTEWAKVGDGSLSVKLDPEHSGGDAMFSGPGLGFMRIVVNSALYLASSNPDIIAGLREPPNDGPARPSKKERRKFERQVTGGAYTVVGSNVRDYQIPEDSEGNKLDHRVKVRGHWKSQAYGVGRSERKHIFVEPYWKGPEAADVLSRPYLARR